METRPPPPPKPTPPVEPQAIPDQDPGVATPDATGGIIPYKNPAALIAYYFGIAGLFPVLGLLLAAPAVVLGIIGLRRRANGRAWGGAVHAWIAIVLGSIASLYNGFLAFTLIVALLAN